MGLFGSLFGKKKSAFEQGFEGYQLPEQQNPGMAPGMEPNDGAPMPEKRKSFLETGQPHGWDWAGLALGAIGDALAQQNGGQAVMMPMALQSMMGARGAREAAARKQQTIQALMARGMPETEASILAEDNDATNKIIGGKYEQHAPKDPYRWESNDGSLMELGQDGQPRQVYKDPTPKTEWVKTQNPDGTITMMPMPQGGGGPVGRLTPVNYNPQGSAGPSPQDIERVRQSLVASFPGPLGESKFEEWKQRNLGGAGGNASGGFR